MYTCERLGENATEFRYTAVGGDISGSSAGTWARAAVAVVGASLFSQVWFVFSSCLISFYVMIFYVRTAVGAAAQEVQQQSAGLVVIHCYTRTSSVRCGVGSRSCTGYWLLSYV